MDSLIDLKNSDWIVSLLLSNYALFQSFEQVFLFGSCLQNNKVPKDIDLLLVYGEYSESIKNSISYIYFEGIMGITVDLTILSLNEVEETNFLKRIVVYKQLK